MLSPEQIKSAIAGKNLNKIARESGVNQKVVWKLANGQSKAPSFDSISRLSAYLEKNND